MQKLKEIPVKTNIPIVTQVVTLYCILNCLIYTFYFFFGEHREYFTKLDFMSIVVLLMIRFMQRQYLNNGLKLMQS